MQDAGCWLLDAGFWLLVPGYLLLVTGHLLLVTRYLSRVTVSGIGNSKSDLLTHGFFGHEKSGGKAIGPMPRSKRFLAVRSFLVLGREQLYGVSLTAFNFCMSLSNEMTTFSGEERAARIQSTISILEFSYFSNASSISDLSGFTMPEKFNIVCSYNFYLSNCYSHPLPSFPCEYLPSSREVFPLPGRLVHVYSLAIARAQHRRRKEPVDLSI